MSAFGRLWERACCAMTIRWAPTIARALAVHAQIILADEPTGNLDTENSTQIIQLLSRLAHEENCCVVVVTHDLEVAKEADVVFRMDSGRIKEETV